MHKPVSYANRRKEVLNPTRYSEPVALDKDYLARESAKRDKANRIAARSLELLAKREERQRQLTESIQPIVTISPKKLSWKKYKTKVWVLTDQQPLHTLPFIFFRGFKTWHLDHIVSIWDGHKHNIPAEWIADVSNLRMIPREENERKTINSEPKALSAMLAKVQSDWE